MASGEWRRRHGELYDKATTHHPYIASIRDGSVDLECYKRWLGQDYIFVKAFARFIASLMVKLPKQTKDDILMTLLGGIAALHDELKWFQTQALTWGIDLQELRPYRQAQVYCQYLERMSDPDVSFVVALSTLWAIEIVYCESFSFCTAAGAKPPPQLAEACDRWGNPSFRDYCSVLSRLVDECVELEPPGVAKQAEEAFVEVLELEVGFWNMSSGDT